MSIRQINASYVADEDRVMLRFTTLANEEYRLWLTRSVVGALMQQTEALAVKKLTSNHKVQQAQAVAQFKQQALQQSAVYTQFEGAARFPLGAEPILVKALQAGLQGEVPMLVLQLARGQNLSLRLSDDLLGKLQLLMHKMNDAARWALHVLPDAAVATQPALGDARSSAKDLQPPRRLTVEDPDIKPAPGQAASAQPMPDPDPRDELTPGDSLPRRKLLH
ncbi:hypothetical protein B9Z51_01605 [Limnohabitans sp. T6-5]|uniref:hypothetical protein n=1 Tax=Limnohabitans sp. T6-5 TaxID=1100724 RepID=UPI000D3B8D07|nr:hypothetical protein [Limnohabitans sp. T6-5]PUE11053.1 hypothetical protein B9Z51_01605 [Limnohabitans sp. T6-5]